MQCILEHDYTFSFLIFYDVKAIVKFFVERALFLPVRPGARRFPSISQGWTLRKKMGKRKKGGP